jgi:hypothetical protein
VIGDDCLVFADISQRLVCSTYSGIRLWPESYRALYARRTRGARKIRIAPKGSAASDIGIAPLGALFVLRPSRAARASIRLLPLSARDLVIEMVRHSFQLDPLDPASAQTQFELSTRAASSFPGYRLAFPHRFAAVGDVCASIKSSLAR